MDPSAAVVLSHFSQSVRSLSSWRWGDVASPDPDTAIDCLRDLKALLVREYRSVEAARVSYNRLGCSTEDSVPPRTCLHFLLNSNLIHTELLPLLDVALESGESMGEVEAKRRERLVHAVTRVLCALTMAGDHPTDTDRAILGGACLASLSRIPALSCVLRSLGDVVVRRLGGPLPRDDIDHVEVVLTLVRNLTEIASRSTQIDVRDGYVQNIHDSGALELLLVVLKQNNNGVKPLGDDKPRGGGNGSGESERWNTIIIGTLAALLRMVPNMVDLVQSKGSHVPAPCLPKATSNAPPPRSAMMSTELLVRKAVTGESVVCRSDRAWNDRLKELDANKRRRNVGGSRNADTGVAVAALTATLPQRSRFLLGEAMSTFVSNCFEEYMNATVGGVMTWSRSADDGTEKFEEAEAMKADDCCPKDITNFFLVVSSSLGFTKEQLKADPKLFNNLAKSVLLPTWSNELMETALRVSCAVHQRCRAPEMVVMVNFLKEFVTSLAMFAPGESQMRLKKRLVDADVDVHGRCMTWLRTFNERKHPHEYVCALVQLTHVATSMFRLLPDEDEMEAIMCIASNPRHMYPYYCALLSWEHNATETNRSIISLFYSMVHVKAHPPLLNVAFLFVYSDILKKTAGQLMADGNPAMIEMRKFAVTMVRASLDAMRQSRYAAVRMLFWLGSSQWQDLDLGLSEETMKHFARRRKTKKKKDNNKNDDDSSDEEYGFSDHENDREVEDVDDTEKGSDDDDDGGENDTNDDDPADEDVQAMLRRMRRKWRHELSKRKLIDRPKHKKVKT